MLSGLGIKGVKILLDPQIHYLQCGELVLKLVAGAGTVAVMQAESKIGRVGRVGRGVEAQGVGKLLHVDILDGSLSEERVALGGIVFFLGRAGDDVY